RPPRLQTSIPPRLQTSIPPRLQTSTPPLCPHVYTLTYTPPCLHTSRRPDLSCRLAANFIAVYLYDLAPILSLDSLKLMCALIHSFLVSYFAIVIVIVYKQIKNYSTDQTRCTSRQIKM